MDNEEISVRKILFVCNANQLRSPTAEKIYSDRKDLEVKSVGISQLAKQCISQEIVDWADIIFVMEKNQQNKIIRKFKGVYNKKSVINLEIPDEYEFMEESLISTLKTKLNKYIGLP